MLFTAYYALLILQRYFYSFVWLCDGSIPVFRTLNSYVYTNLNPQQSSSYLSTIFLYYIVWAGFILVSLHPIGALHHALRNRFFVPGLHLWQHRMHYVPENLSIDGCSGLFRAHTGLFLGSEGFLGVFGGLSAMSGFSLGFLCLLLLFGSESVVVGTPAGFVVGVYLFASGF